MPARDQLLREGICCAAALLNDRPFVVFIEHERSVDFGELDELGPMYTRKWREWHRHRTALNQRQQEADGVGRKASFDQYNAAATYVLSRQLGLPKAHALEQIGECGGMITPDQRRQICALCHALE